MKENKDEVKFLPKDISRFPIVRIIKSGKFYLYQVKLDDGRIVTYSKQISQISKKLK